MPASQRRPVVYPASFSCLGPYKDKMSVTFSISAARSGALGATAAAFSFSTVMSDDAKALAQRLKRRDSELLDRLIEQYPFRLFRYLLHLPAHRERAEDFFQ